MTAILIWFDHGDRSETGSSVVSSVISRWAQGLEMSTDDIYGVQIVEGQQWGLGRSQLLTLQWWCSSQSNMCKLEKKVINVSATCLIFIASSHQCGGELLTMSGLAVHVWKAFLLTTMLSVLYSYTVIQSHRNYVYQYLRLALEKNYPVERLEWCRTLYSVPIIPKFLFELHRDRLEKNNRGMISIGLTVHWDHHCELSIYNYLMI